MRFILFIMACFSLVGTASAEMVEYAYTKDGWYISRDTEGDYCLAMTSYEKGDLAGFMIHPDGGVNMIFTDPAISVIQHGEKISLELVFLDSADNLDDSWGTVTFTNIDIKNRKVVMSEKLNYKALADIARNRLWGVFRDEKIIESYSLYGSAEAIQQAKRCIGLNPKDPFLK